MSAPVPTLALVVEEGWVSVSVANPNPGGGETPATSNRIERRGGGAWLAVGTTAPNTTWRDYTVASGGSYEYRAVAIDAAAAETVGLASAPVLVRLVGSWLHRVSQGGAAGRAYPYLTDNRKETLVVQATPLLFVGRPRAVMEFGDSEEGTLSIAVLVPFDSDHDDRVQWLKDTVRAREVVLYRDNRGRFVYSVITALDIEDIRNGTKLAFTVNAVDFEVV